MTIPIVEFFRSALSLSDSPDWKRTKVTNVDSSSFIASATLRFASNSALCRSGSKEMLAGAAGCVEAGAGVTADGPGVGAGAGALAGAAAGVGAPLGTDVGAGVGAALGAGVGAGVGLGDGFGAGGAETRKAATGAATAEVANPATVGKVPETDPALLVTTSNTSPGT